MVYDGADNTGVRNVIVTRTGLSLGAVIIMGGRNEANDLQTNINNMTNHAYRVFLKGPAYDPASIYYLAPSSQDADGDGSNDVDAPASRAGLDSAIRTWARGKVGAGKPLHLYLGDHGLVEGFCANGCNAGQIGTDDLDAALSDLETHSGVNQVNIIMEGAPFRLVYRSDRRRRAASARRRVASSSVPRAATTTPMPRPPAATSPTHFSPASRPAAP